MAAGLADGSAAALQYSSADLLNLTYDGILRCRFGNRRDDSFGSRHQRRAGRVGCPSRRDLPQPVNETRLAPRQPSPEGISLSAIIAAGSCEPSEPHRTVRAHTVRGPRVARRSGMSASCQLRAADRLRAATLREWLPNRRERSRSVGRGLL
jgi:hypothetical protein